MSMFLINNSNLLLPSLYNNEFEIASMLHNSGARLTFINRIFSEVIISGNVKMFKWLINHNYKINSTIITLIFNSDKFNIFINILDIIDLIDILYTLNLEQLKKIHQYRNLTSFTPTIINNAQEKKDKDIINWCNYLIIIK